MANLAMFGSEEAWRAAHDEADELLRECHDVEDRLGLPHVDNDYFHLSRDDASDVVPPGDNIGADERLPPDEVAPPPPDE